MVKEVTDLKLAKMAQKVLMELMDWMELMVLKGQRRVMAEKGGTSVMMEIGRMVWERVKISHIYLVKGDEMKWKIELLLF